MSGLLEADFDENNGHYRAVSQEIMKKTIFYMVKRFV
jgi:hypothetical protein